MPKQEKLQNSVIVALPPEPNTAGQLEKAIKTLRDGGPCDTIVDFSQVDILRSPTLRRLIILRQTLLDAGHRLVLCNLAPVTRGIFATTCLNKVFDLAEDKIQALHLLCSDDLPQ